MFKELEKVNSRPKAFEFYTASDLWADEYISKQMLSYHLNADIDVSSRNAKFIEGSVKWIASNFNVGKGTRVADFGCGPGLYALPLAKSGAEVTGIDFSKNSIEYARDAAEKAGVSIEYVNENYLEFETEQRFDLIIMIMCDFCALSPAQRKVMLEKFNQLLAPGGSLLLDVYSHKSYENLEEKTLYELNQFYGLWSPNKYYGFVNTFKYEEEKVILDKYTIVEADRTRTVYNWLQYFTPETITPEFEACGFTVNQLYSDVAGSTFDTGSKEFAILAKKK